MNMYLKVPYRNHNLLTTTKEVEDALAEIDGTEGCWVDMDFNYPSVNFPFGAQYADKKRVEGALIERGFEAY